MLRNLSQGLRGLLKKDAGEREMDEELRGFLTDSAQEKMRTGMSREEAWRSARMEMGGIENVKQRVRAVSWETHIEMFWRDVRFAARQLRANRLFTAAAILSLALGIGANTTIFQLIDAVRLRSLPVRKPQEIAKIAIENRKSASGHFSSRYPDVTYGMWQQIRAQQQGFSEVFAWGPTNFNTASGGEVRNVQGLWVSGEFFETLGVEPAIGRLLAPADDQAGCAAPGAVLSYAFSQREYGGDPKVLERTITLERKSFPIIGITSADFHGVEVGRYFDVAVPLCAEPLINGDDNQTKDASGWWLAVMGRLKPGWGMERASAQLRAISPALMEATLPPQFNASNAKYFLQYKLHAFPGDAGVSELREDYEQPLWVLLGLAGSVLLIASANLANLMLTRGSARAREMAIRLALGAGRGRLVRQLLIESALLALIGAALGAALAKNLSQVLMVSLSTQHDPLFMDLALDWRMLGFTAALAALTCILCGLAPALRATQVTPGAVLKESGRGLTGTRSQFTARRILVVTQIALSLTLLVGALLFARSLNKLTSLDAGFRQDGIVVTDVDFTALRFGNEARREFAQQVLKKVQALPGVDSAALATIVPLSGDGIGHDILLGDSGEPDGEPPAAAFNNVSAGYFHTLNMPILKGRDFDERDAPGSARVAIVNEAFAAQFFKGENPLGQRFRVRRLRTITFCQVVGLVKNSKYIELRENFSPIVYTAIAQNEPPGTNGQILIRSNAPLNSVIAGVKRATSELSNNVDIKFFNFHQMIQEGLMRDRLMARLSAFFGGLAVVLAMIGLYGVISYMMARRKNEIAIRMALGADSGSILRMVMTEAGALLGIGLALGTITALGAGHAAAALLFGLKPNDPGTLVTAVLTLSIVAALATALPAKRAAGSDPVVALREE